MAVKIASFLKFLVIFLSLKLFAVLGLPNLGIQWNPTAKANNWNNFGARLVYDEEDNVKDQDQVLTDQMLVGLARQAYDEMVALPDYQPNTRTRPPTIAALAVGNEVFLASSISPGFSGANSFLYDWGGDPQTYDGIPEATHMLDACQVELVETGDRNYRPRHRSNAHCAEIMAIHYYLRTHPESNFWGKDARVATWGRGGGLGPGIFLPACGRGGIRPENWGCYQFAIQLGITPIQNNPGPLDFTVSPKESSQVEMCWQR